MSDGGMPMMHDRPKGWATLSNGKVERASQLYVQRTEAKFNEAPGAEIRMAAAAPTKSKVKLVRRPLGEGKAGEGGSPKLTRQK